MDISLQRQIEQYAKLLGLEELVLQNPLEIQIYDLVTSVEWNEKWVILVTSSKAYSIRNIHAVLRACSIRKTGFCLHQVAFFDQTLYVACFLSLTSDAWEWFRAFQCQQSIISIALN